MIHALVAAAWGAGNRIDSVVPDGILIEAPEQSRLRVEAGSRYAFGLTVLDTNGRGAVQRVETLVAGLKTIGRQRALPKTVFGGNFRVVQIDDLIAGNPARDGSPLQAIPAEHFIQETARIKHQQELTLRFDSPLLAERPKNLPPQHPRDRGKFMDRNWFGPATLIRRLANRLVQLGLTNPDIADIPFEELQLIANQLVWMSFSYGPGDRRKPKYGSLGRARLGNITPEIARLLVLGQYVHVGGALRFGFGKYCIEELGAEPFACHRAVELDALAFDPIKLDQLAHDLDLPSGILPAVNAIRHGSYRSEPHAQVVIGSADNPRTLSIPSRRDRALQRCVHDLLAPAIDRLLEDSSLGYRQGLGIHHAARRLQQAVQRGYHWALKADFRQFFDSIRHDELEQRLEAWIGDDRLVRLIMTWIRSGSPHAGRGVPTGAGISPLVSNLFLDEFDEAVEAEGGFLVRYADDFLILYRTREEALASQETAAALANQICLELNEAKTRMLDLSEPFEFLGFRFEMHERWEFNTLDHPTRIRDLGWEKKKSAAQPETEIRLPGESQIAETGDTTVICGPNVRCLNAQGKRLIVEYDDGSRTSSLPLEHLRELVLIDIPDMSRSALNAMNRYNISWSLIDSFGNPRGTFVVNDPLDAHTAVLAQFEAAVDPKICLRVARQLIEAKLLNHAALARAFPGRFNDMRTGDRLKRLAGQAQQANSIEQLLGIEGSGAAQWYQTLGGRIPKHFSFERRVAPGASDPVNAMLNLGQRILYNMIVHKIQIVGLVPATGLLHQPRSGHAALASDLQEPFRHLVDRAVLETLPKLKNTDFTEDHDGPYPLLLKPRAVKLLVGTLHQILMINCQSRGQSLPKPYRMQIVSQIRNLKQHLVSHGESPFKPFAHP